MSKRTHYRNVFKSDHLGIADLEDFLENGKRLVFTIKNVKQEFNTKVAGKNINANIAYFKEDIKPLVLNATNSKQISKFANSPIVEDWINIPVELYIDSTVKMKGEVVGGVRIRKTQPRIEKPKLTIDHRRFDAAKKAWQSGKKEGVLKQFEVSKEVEKLLDAE